MALPGVGIDPGRFEITDRFDMYARYGFDNEAPGSTVPMQTIYLSGNCAFAWQDGFFRALTLELGDSNNAPCTTILNGRNNPHDKELIQCTVRNYGYIDTYGYLIMFNSKFINYAQVSCYAGWRFDCAESANGLTGGYGAIVENFGTFCVQADGVFGFENNVENLKANFVNESGTYEIDGTTDHRWGLNNVAIFYIHSDQVISFREGGTQYLGGVTTLAATSGMVIGQNRAFVLYGGMLQGTGIIIGTVGNGISDGGYVSTAGTVRPGLEGSPGTLAITVYYQNANGKLQIEVTPSGSYSRLVAGTANLTGGTLFVNNPNCNLQSGRLVYLETVNGITGGFSYEPIYAEPTWLGNAYRFKTGNDSPKTKMWLDVEEIPV